MIKADFHLHSDFSSDSKTPMEEMVKQGIALGLEQMCMTDHMDYDFPKQYNMPFEFDVDKYLETIEQLKNKYPAIKLRTGIEVGMRPYLSKRFTELVSSHPFDFVICSSHLLYDLDPYYKETWIGREEKQVFRDYFEIILENIKCFDNFDVYGHIDYVIRYSPSKGANFHPSEYMDILDEILTTLIYKGKGIEANTSGYKYGMGGPHPRAAILKRYLELGGEILTIGSDGHQPNHMAYDFNSAESLLKELGFKYYTVFENRKPTFIKL